MSYAIELKNESGVKEGLIYQDPFVVLSDGATVNWDCRNDIKPTAKLTSTQSFTINMTNVLSGAIGALKLITSTASAITLTFDTDFTNKRLGATGEESFTTYTFPASTGKEYILTFVVDGTTIHWTIGDVLANTSAKPYAALARLANQSINNNTETAISWDTVVDDNNVGYSAVNPTRIPIPGTGEKIALLTSCVDFATDIDGIRRLRIFKNGSAVTFSGGGVVVGLAASGSTVATDVVISAQIPCDGGDYLEVMALHVAGAALNCLGSVQVSILDR